MTAAAKRDLVVLVADRNMKATIGGIFDASDRLGIRRLSSDVFVHPEHDPGCFLHAHDFLDVHRDRYAHALVMLDREGSGQEGMTREQIEAQVQDRLIRAGWGERAAVVAIDPELDNWIWSDSPHVDAAIGWTGRTTDLREWLVRNGHLEQGAVKPARPKEALEAVLREALRPRSSAIYAALMRKVSFKRCTDPAFRKFKQVMHGWFGTPGRQEE